MSKPIHVKLDDHEESSKKYWNSNAMDCSSNEYYDEEDDDEDDEDKLPDDFYNPMSWDKLPDETEEEYEDRMRDQNDFLENLS